MARGVIRLIAALCLIVTACGSAHLPAAEVSPSPQSAEASSSPEPTPEPVAAPTVASAPRLSTTCPAPQLPRSFPSSPTSNRNLVIAKLHGSDQTVIRDVTDMDHPSTVASVNATNWVGAGVLGQPSFVSSSTISYTSSDLADVVRMPLSGSGTSLLALGCPTEEIWTFTWSPVGQSLTYVLSDRDPNSVFPWHLVSGGVDREIGTAPRECICGEIPEDHRVTLGFSHAGPLVSLVESVQMGTDLQVRRLDGTLVGAEIRGDRYASQVTMGVWSGLDLFFRDKQRVGGWTHGPITPFLPGVAWLRPWTAPAAGQSLNAVRGG